MPLRRAPPCCAYSSRPSTAPAGRHDQCLLIDTAIELGDRVADDRGDTSDRALRPRETLPRSYRAGQDRERDRRRRRSRPHGTRPARAVSRLVRPRSLWWRRQARTARRRPSGAVPAASRIPGRPAYRHRLRYRLRRPRPPRRRWPLLRRSVQPLRSHQDRQLLRQNLRPRRHLLRKVQETAPQGERLLGHLQGRKQERAAARLSLQRECTEGKKIDQLPPEVIAALSQGQTPPGL